MAKHFRTYETFGVGVSHLMLPVSLSSNMPYCYVMFEHAYCYDILEDDMFEHV